MGKSSTTQKSQSSTGPWAPAQDPLKGIIADIDGTSLGANPYQPGMESLAQDLLSGGPDRGTMVSDAYSNFQTNIQPHTSAQSMDVLSNPIFQQYLQTITNDTKNAINSQFSAAGRDPSGAGAEYGQALGRGIAAGTAPAFVSAYDSAANRNLAANQSALSGATSAAGLLGNLDAAQFERRGSGVNLGNQIYQMPLQESAIKAGLLTPLAGLGQEGTSTTTQTQKANPVQVATGAALGGMGLLGGFGYNPFQSMGNVWNNYQAYTQPNPWMGR
jgi:hypothetical protein